MTRYLSVFSLCLFIILSIVSSLYPAKLTVASIVIKETPSNQINIEWKSILSKGLFLIYNSSNAPVSNLALLKNATNIFNSELTGIPTNGRYLFNVYIDKPVYNKNYYAIMQTSGNWKDSDLKANENYNINPFVPSDAAPIAKENQTKEQTNFTQQDATNQFGIDMQLLLAPVVSMPVEIPVIPITPGDFYVTNLFLKTNCASILLFWDIGGEKIPDSIQFDIYRVTNAALNESDLSFLTPLASLNDEYNYEDSSVLYGMTYYYTIIPKGNNKIYPGRNQNTNAVFIGITNLTFEVKREILIKTNLKPESFRKRFNNK